MFKRLTKLSLLPITFMAIGCAPSAQQAFQNAKLFLVNDIKEYYVGEQETLANVKYGEMQYIFLSKSNDETFAVDCYYYTGKITLTLGDKKTRAINPTVYYNLKTKKGGIFDDSIKSFNALKKLVDAGGQYSGSQGKFFPSNY